MSITCEFNSVEEWLDELRHAKRHQRLELLPVRVTVEWKRSERLPITHISVIGSFIADLGLIYKLRRYVGDCYGPQKDEPNERVTKKAADTMEVIKEAAAELGLEAMPGIYSFEPAK